MVVESGTTAGEQAGTRAQAPIRWPRPGAFEVLLLLLWLVGVVVALILPALIVSPGAEKAPTGDVLWAGGITVIGTLLMLVTSYLLYRRTHEVGFAVLGGVPALSCMIGGIVLAATKLTGTIR